MEKSITQLLEQIESGHHLPKIMEGFNYEAWLAEQEKEEKLREEKRREEEDLRPIFGSYCGLTIEDFPPAEELKDHEMQILIDAVNRMSASWSLLLQLPVQLPKRLEYELTIEFLNEKIPILEGDGFLILDHCCCNPAECIYKEYCHCLKYRLDN